MANGSMAVPRSRIFIRRCLHERKGATIEISMASLRFLGPDVAKENGQTRVKPTGGEPATYRDYTVLYVKQDGRWLYSSVREEHPANARPSRTAQGAGVACRRLAR